MAGQTMKTTARKPAASPPLIGPGAILPAFVDLLLDCFFLPWTQINLALFPQKP